MLQPRGRLASVLLMILAAALWPGHAASAAAVPYSDPNAGGALTLCDAANRPVRSGSVHAAPFVASAVSSFAAPAPYGQDGRTATLFAFQPREGVSPGQWSGDLMTAATRYTTPDHPIAKFTAADGSLGDFLDAYPPTWDGYIQLRIYLGAPGQPAYSQRYAAADLHVTGASWTVVSDGVAPCESGQGTSVEDLLPTANTSRSISGVALTTVPQSAQAAPPKSADARVAAAVARSSGSGSHAAAANSAAAALLGGISLSAVLVRRVRRTNPQLLAWRSR